MNLIDFRFRMFCILRDFTEVIFRKWDGGDTQ